MQKYLIFSLICFSFFVLSPKISAQNPNTELSKSEKKKWKTIARAYGKNPVALKLLTEEHSYLKKNSTEWEAEIVRLKEMLATKNQNNSMQLATIEELRSEILSLQEELQRTRMTANQNQYDIGVWFRVQIGAYEKEQLNAGQLNSDKLSVEGGDLQRIVLGHYRNYDEAQQMRDNLRKLGLKDAWIVSYKDGRRIPIEDALRN